MTNGVAQPLNGVVGPGSLPYVGTPWPSPGTLNMWSNINHHWSAPCTDPFYVDLSIGLAYSFTVANTTDNDIDSGTIELWGADADPTDWCKPGTFHALDPVAGCTAIVTGHPEAGPVTITLGPDVVIRAHALCKFAAPCPKPFFQVRGLPAGCQAWATISSLRRTNFDHLTPWGFIPRPMDIGVESMMAPAAQAQLPPGQPAVAAQPQRPGQQPQPQPQPPQRTPHPRPPAR